MTLDGRKLNRASKPWHRTNIGAQTYTYNGLGDRVRVNKPTGTRHFVYDSQGRVVAEYGASASDVKAEFIWALPPAANDNSPFGGDDGIVGYAPLALVTTNTSSQLTLYWVHGNHLGVPIVTTNALGQVVDPGNDFLRPGFPGQSQVLSDLYYNRARDYDPVLGRYIQADPIGLMGGSNSYLYANGDPVNMIDPHGLFIDTLADAAFVVYDLYRIGKDNVFGDCDNLGENLTALGLDFAGIFVPFATGGGLIVRAAERVAQTGANRTIAHWDFDAAETAYNSIRGSNSDIIQIAGNTGMRDFHVARIKDHLFNSTHRLDGGVVSRFDAHPEIANAWNRLSAGTHTRRDTQLLRHELFESKFEGIFRTNYRTAHDAANRAGRLSGIE